MGNYYSSIHRKVKHSLDKLSGKYQYLFAEDLDSGSLGNMGSSKNISLFHKAAQEEKEYNVPKTISEMALILPNIPMANKGKL